MYRLITKFLLIMFFSSEAVANYSYKCIELERVTVAGSGLMTPAYPGRSLTFIWDGATIEANGVFYHQNYEMSPFSDVNGNTGFKAFAVDEDRQDIFYFLNGQLFHTAIVSYGREPSIQSEIFDCIKSFID